MRIKPGFRLTDICGTNILIAEGQENIDFSNIISMNESAKLLWENIADKDFTIDDLARILTDNYQIDDDTSLPYDQALKDATDIARQWIDAGVVEA